MEGAPDEELMLAYKAGNAGAFETLYTRHRARLFETEGDWYGESVSVELVARLRDTVKFDGLEALKTQLGRDRDAAKAALTQA